VRRPSNESAPHGKVALVINLIEDQETACVMFEKLSRNGEVIMNLEEMFWGALFGDGTG